MKKLLIYILFMVVATSCVKDDVETPEYDAQYVAVNFGASSMCDEPQESSTRGAVKEGSFAVGDTFGVVAYHVAEGGDITSTTSPTYINNLCVTYGENGVCSYTVSDTEKESEYVFSLDGVNYYYYLPQSGKTYFYAYYPYDATADFSTIEGYPSFGCTISSSVNEQKDMLVSTQSIPSDAGVVDFSFFHVLSQVSFGAYGTGDFSFKTIEVGTLHNQGTVTIDDKGAFSWAIPEDAVATQFVASAENKDIDDTVVPSVSSGNEETTVQITTSTGYFFMIPQTFTDLSVNVTTSDGDTHYFTVDGEWKTGLTYMYKIGTTGVYDISYDVDNDCYNIYTALGLCAFRDMVNGLADSSSGTVKTNAAEIEDGTSYFVFGTADFNLDGSLKRDIDLDGYCGASWAPIGVSNTDAGRYKGDFNGNGYKVSNLLINTSNDYQGLFGATQSNTIENITMVNASVTLEPGDDDWAGYAGALIGIANGVTDSETGSKLGTTIKNCGVEESRVTSNQYNTGALIGDMRNYSSAEGCWAKDVVVIGGTKTGGIVGFLTGESTIKSCTFYSGTVTGTGRYVGGIVGGTHNTLDGAVVVGTTIRTTVENCIVEGGTIESTAGAASIYSAVYGSQLFSTVGGIAGSCGDEPEDYTAPETYSSYILITGCTNAAEVKGAAQNVGGIVGGNHGDIENCENYGTVTNTGSVTDTATTSATDALRIGGIAGRSLCSGTISNCINYGEVIAGNAYRVGGIVGGNNSNVTNCHNKKTVTAAGYYGGVVGYSLGNADLGDYTLTISGCSNSAALSGGTKIGGILGGTDPDVHDTHINNCWNEGEITGSSDTGDQGIGGIVGEIYGGEIIGCYNTATITSSTSYCGGIAGEATDTKITSSYNEGYVNSDNTSGQRLGGIIGYIIGGTISQCYNTSDIYSKASYCGGIVGEASGATIELSYNTGYVESSNQYTGGIAGNAKESSTISKCYNTGEIYSNTAARCGGIAGGTNASSIKSSYNTGYIHSSNTALGGVVGYASTGGSIEYCYNTGLTKTTTTATNTNSGIVVGNGNLGDPVITISNCFYIPHSENTLSAVGNPSTTVVGSCDTVSALNSSLLTSDGDFTAGDPADTNLPQVMGENLVY